MSNMVRKPFDLAHECRTYMIALEYQNRPVMLTSADTEAAGRSCHMGQVVSRDYGLFTKRVSRWVPMPRVLPGFSHQLPSTRRIAGADPASPRPNPILLSRRVRGTMM